MSIKQGIFLIVFISVGLSYSCKNAVRKVDNIIKFDTTQVVRNYHYQTIRTVHLHPDTIQLGYSLNINCIYPVQYTNLDILSKIQKIFVGKLLGESFQNLTVSEALKSFEEQYISEYKRFEQSLSSTDRSSESDEFEDGYEDDKIYPYYMEAWDSIVFNKNNLLSFLVKSTNHAGGVRGQKSTYAYVIDLNSGKLISQDELWGHNTESAISNLLIEKIKKENGLKTNKELEELNYSIEDIIPNNNFSVNENGIIYYFNEDEIAPYIMGQTEIFLPFKEISVYLSDESPVASLCNY